MTLGVGAPCSSISASAIDAGVEAAYVDVIIGGPPVEHGRWDPPPPGEPAGLMWSGIYYAYDITATAPSSSNTMRVWLWAKDDYGIAALPEDLPPGAIVVYQTLQISVAFAVSGIYMKAETEETPAYSTSILAFTERVLKQTWFADEAATVSATATVGANSVSASGTLTEAGQEIELGTNFALSFGWTIHEYDYSDVVYARVSDIKWNGKAVDLSHLDLYSPGDDAPDSSYPDWGRTQTQENCFRIGHANGAETWSHNYQLGSVVNKSWQGRVWAPLWVVFTPRTGKFADDVAYSDILVKGTPIEWYQDSGGNWLSRQLTFSGQREFISQRKSWEFEHEYKTLSSNIFYLDWDRDDMKTKGEDVGEDDSPDTNNQACALEIHPINVENLEGNPYDEWPAGLLIAHEEPIRVVKPPGISRPANWVGSNGLTPDSTNNDLWRVAAGSTNATATLTLATRKWNRLNRIVQQDPALGNLMKHRDLLIINRPNLDQIGGEYLDPESERIPENEWHWKNFAYGELRIKAPRQAQIEIIVDYSTVTATDPCYPTLEQGEFEYTRSTHQVKYKVTVEATPAGQDYSSVVFDLAVPIEGDIAPNLWHVDKITLRILGTAVEDEEWIFDDIYLSGSYWQASWGDEPDSHFECRLYDPWDFLADYTGFAGVVSGIKCFDIPYGYEEYERVERSLKQRQKARSRSTGQIMDYAKPLRRLKDEIYWQRGWAATYYNPEDSAANKDSEGNKLIGTFRWWDLYRFHEWKFDSPPRSTSQELKVVPIVRQIHAVAGIKHVIYYEKFAQGRAHGLAFATDRSGRLRYEGSVKLYRRPAGGGTWVEVDEDTPDGHGRFRLGPGLEKGYEYKVDDYATVYTFANTRYVWARYTAAVSRGDVCRNYAGCFFLLIADGSTLKLYFRQGINCPWHGPYTVAELSSGAAALDVVEGGGGMPVLIVETNDGKVAIIRVEKLGEGRQLYFG